MSKKEKKEKTDSKTPSWLVFLKSEQFRFLSGLLLLVLAFYILLSQISYLFTWKTDNIEWITIFSGSDVIVDNWGGKFGAYIANTLILKWFGMASFLFPVALVIIGTQLIRKPILPLYKSLIIGMLAMVLASLVLGIFDNLSSSTNFLLGGLHGFIIVAWLKAFLGWFGTIGLIVVLVVSFIALVSAQAFKWMLKHIQNPKNLLNKESDDNSTIEEEILDKNLDTNASEDIDILEIQDQKPENEIPLDISSIESEESVEADEIVFSINSENETEEDYIEDNSTDIAETIDGEDDSAQQADDFSELNEEGEIDLRVEEMKAEEEGDVDENELEVLSDYDPRADLSNYHFPNKEILVDHEVNNTKVTQEELNENKDRIVDTLKNYKIEITNITATIGPSITLYEIVPAPGVRISKIKNLEDDIALSLSALGIRIIAPMPGKGTVGIEVPNKNPQVVSMRATIASKTFQESKYELPIILGKNIYNKTHVIDLAKTPHMLVAGATGQGKSVGINAILTSLLYKKHPAEIKFVLIDPKKVELSIYSRIEKHFLAKIPNEDEAIITDVQKVVATLNSLAKEMDDRYDLLKNAHVRNIIEYNSKFINRRLNPQKGHRYLPYIVVVIDEFADLIMTAGKEVEHPIARIAQLARAIGIHLIVATQRPSTNVITGMIKANFPTRVAFRVTQMIDSRTILDSPGANQLIGRGDMLVSQGGGEMIRLQCPFVDTPEVEELVTYIESQQGYPTALYLPEPDAEALGGAADVDLKQRDELFDEAARLMVQTQQGSTSSIQRKFSIGYNRAGRIIDQLEAAGIVGPYEGSKARKVNFGDEYSLEQFLKTLE
ncbi:MAG: DNA translocase FtsK [Bacteroidales bacterium]|nr:DNA translocase FtsK [Bacteroidales bacterium]